MHSGHLETGCVNYIKTNESSSVMIGSLPQEQKAQSKGAKPHAPRGFWSGSPTEPAQSEASSSDAGSRFVLRKQCVH